MIILQANKFFHEKGGSERYMFALSRALGARGHEIVDFSMHDGRNLPSPYSRHFVTQRDYDGPWRFASLSAVINFVWSKEAAHRLDALLSERLPDVAHLHNIYHQLTPSIIASLSRRRVPVVMTLHDYKLVCPSYALFARGEVCRRCRGGRFFHAVTVSCAGGRARSALLAAESYWQRWTRAYDRVDYFIAPSEFLRDVMIDGGIRPERIVFVPPLNPSSTEPSAQAEDDARLPGRFVAYVGRLSREKGVHVLLSAMAHTRGITLVVFGDGPEAGALRRQAQERSLDVVFAGHAGRRAINTALARATAVILPTLSPENAPMAVLEAADAGAPVIVSDRGGLPELARRVGGVVVPAGDDAALARAITDAWNDTKAWREHAQRAWRESAALHGADVHVQKVEAIYRRAIERRRAA